VNAQQLSDKLRGYGFSFNFTQRIIHEARTKGQYQGGRVIVTFEGDKYTFATKTA